MNCWCSVIVALPFWRLLACVVVALFVAIAVPGIRSAAGVGLVFTGVAVGLAWHAQFRRSLLIAALLPWALGLCAAFVLALPVQRLVRQGRDIYLQPNVVVGGGMLVLAWFIAFAVLIASIVAVRSQSWSGQFVATIAIAGVFLMAPFAALAGASNASIERAPSSKLRLLPAARSIHPTACPQPIKRSAAIFSVVPIPEATFEGIQWFQLEHKS